MSAQRVPAWKRLGLKLKGHAPEESPPGNTAHQSDGGRVKLGVANANKRKDPPALDSDPNKKVRGNGVSANIVHGQQGAAPVKKKKSVTFAAGTDEGKKSDAQPNGPKTGSRPKAKKPKKDRAKPAADFNLGPAISYLRQWREARDSWKFNKNHQTLLIKYVFDGERIPSADVPIFYEYIRDLKGFVRTRLYDTAAEIKKKDMEQGLAAFPEATQDKEDKQKEYEVVISRFLDRHKAREAQRICSSNGNRKRTLDEVEFVLRIADPTVRQRVCKRIRAEHVLDELSDSAEMTTTAEGTASSTALDSAGGNAMDMDEGSKPPDKETPHAGPAQGRVKKVRTPGEEKAESSSETGTDEESSDESSSSEDSDEEDADADEAAVQDGQESSSSSSSSSSEGEDEDDEEESSDEE